jgi:hypothetical protein
MPELRPAPRPAAPPGDRPGRLHLPLRGDGVAVPLSEVVVTPPGTPPALLGYPGQDGLAAQLRDLSPDPGYVGALAMLSPRPVVVHERSAERLLTAG